MRPDQSTSSVEPPAGPDGRSAGLQVERQGDDLVGQQGAGVVAEAAGEGGARAAGADGDGERAVAGDRREDERAVGGLVGGVDPDPGGRRGRGDGGVDVGAARSP